MGGGRGRVNNCAYLINYNYVNGEGMLKLLKSWQRCFAAKGPCLRVLLRHHIIHENAFFFFVIS
jgi:hypothetical protein